MQVAQIETYVEEREGYTMYSILKDFLCNFGLMGMVKEICTIHIQGGTYVCI